MKWLAPAATSGGGRSLTEGVQHPRRLAAIGGGLSLTEACNTCDMLDAVNRRWVEDRRLSSILVLAAIAWLFELLDGATAISMMQQLGPASELNPVVRELFRSVGPLGVVLLKVGLASVVIPMFAYLGLRGRRLVLARISLLVAIGFAVLGIASNVV